MEISRRLFIFLVSTVIGFMLALVVAVGVLVVRGPAGQVHAASAVAAGTEELFEEEAENRLSEIEGEELQDEAPAALNEVAEEEEAVDTGSAGKLGSLSPEARALFEEGEAEAEEGAEGAEGEEGAEGAEGAELQPEPTEEVEALDAPSEEAEALLEEGAVEPSPEPSNVLEEAQPEEQMPPPVAVEEVGGDPEPTEPTEPIEAVEAEPEIDRVAEAVGEPEPEEKAQPVEEAEAKLVPAPGDRDGDGIPDRTDKCIDQPEDKDGFESLDGCPDPDNDKDGVLDAQDQCPFEKESLNGYDDADGCPDVKPAAKATATEKKAAAPAAQPEPTPEGKTWSVHFGHMRWALNKSAKRVARRSVRSGKRAKAVYIRGQSDAGGKASVNRWYANKRAKAVRRYLVAKGVPMSRIQIMDAVIIDADTVNRSKSNRRVDIIVVK